MIIGGSASQKLAANVAEELGDWLCPIETKKFPDGERYIRINGKSENGELDKEAVIVQSTGYPQDENLIELLFLIKNLKSLNVETIKVVIPYFGYGRQEKRFKDGEAISAQIVANLLENAGVNQVLSINLHEDSVRDFFSIPSTNICAMGTIAEYIDNLSNDPIIIAPDKGALGFAEKIAKALDCTCTYMDKVRLGPDKVETKIADIRCDFSSNDPDFVNNEKKVDMKSVKGKEAIIIDDIIATGGTIVNAIKILKDHGAKNVRVCCVHPILVNDAILKIYAAGAKSIAGTDSLKSEVSCISIARIIADALR
ncbi:ribose-phosphate pyrophosphokinase [Methanobrevibacter cuticularis]|uniref:Ribose-phosphate pyrophosphokinase n=1 Tax=Methanobrevibacter cuticularis TaxID=47311 RepID=A0A166F7R2_9EURY|nr:ribose-phosphate diphosphokinase [Methanobrevibacter cuticularis]KZX17403.1 ribose-phosphate pyrophosphokinase [Methanobrevibacter cuticularis]